MLSVREFVARLLVVQEHDGKNRILTWPHLLRRCDKRRITDGMPVAVLATHAAGSDSAGTTVAKTAKRFAARDTQRLTVRKHGLQDVTTGAAEHFGPHVAKHLLSALVPGHNVASPVDGECGVGRQSDYLS